ncbi:hypothetical protein BRC86_06975 [Halobacteriales archaeon QS_3_64_16]|nr:MAG: hypothetical protein BRC86_06975 [Halobacteriales archaeon QS_3_64_16]
MVNDARKRFLAGESPEEVLVYLAESGVSDIEALADRGEEVEKGVVLVLGAERGRRVAERAIGTDPMDLASRAMDTEGEIDLEALIGACPAALDRADSSSTEHPDIDGKGHTVRYAFAFAEERNEEVGGIYAEGDVIHAYAVCDCGTAYSDRWVADET